MFGSDMKARVETMLMMAPSLAEQRDRRPAHQEGSGQVAVGHLAPVGQRQFGHRPAIRPGDARVVDQKVEASHPSSAKAAWTDASSPTSQITDRVPSRTRLQIEGGDGPAVGDQGLADAPADQARGSGDDGFFHTGMKGSVIDAVPPGAGTEDFDS